MQYQLFDSNPIKILDYVEITKLYSKEQRSASIINYLTKNKFDIEKFHQFLLMIEKRDQLKHSSKIYNLTIDTISELEMIILTEFITYNKIIFTKEHVFYCKYIYLSSVQYYIPD